MKPLTNETAIERFEKEFRCKSIACPKPCPSLKSDEMEPIKKFLKSAIQAKEREIQEKIIGEIEKRFKMFEQSKTGWMITGINIRLEDWKEFKSKLSNLSEK